MIIMFNISTKKQFIHTKVYLSAGQEQSELRLDQLDEELNNIADGHQRDIDGTL